MWEGEGERLSECKNDDKMKEAILRPLCPFLTREGGEEGEIGKETAQVIQTGVPRPYSGMNGRSTAKGTTFWF